MGGGGGGNHPGAGLALQLHDDGGGGVRAGGGDGDGAGHALHAAAAAPARQVLVSLGPLQHGALRLSGQELLTTLNIPILDNFYLKYTCAGFVLSILSQRAEIQCKVAASIISSLQLYTGWSIRPL